MKWLCCIVLIPFISIKLSASICSPEVSEAIKDCMKKNEMLGREIGECSEYIHGFSQRIVNGMVFYSEQTGAHAVTGVIFSNYMERGGASSKLGFPISSTTQGSDNVGISNRFENGVLYFHPATGTRALEGAVLQKWKELGAENSVLGYPIGEQFSLRNGALCVRFQFGNIYSQFNLGTYVVYGEVFERYSIHSWENGMYGYPVSDPELMNGTMSQKFEYGQIQTNPYFRDLRHEIGRRQINIKDQKKWDIRKVHAVTFALEYAYSQWCGHPFGGWTSDLSEMFLLHGANLIAGKSEGYQTMKNIIDAYETFGIVVESNWANDTLGNDYDYNYFTQDSSQRSKWEYISFMSQSMIGSGMRMNPCYIKKADGTKGLSKGQMDSVVASIRQGYPVIIDYSRPTVAVGYGINSTDGQGSFFMRSPLGELNEPLGYYYEPFDVIESETYSAIVFYFPHEAERVKSTLRQIKKQKLRNTSRMNVKDIVRVISMNGRTIVTVPREVYLKSPNYSLRQALEKTGTPKGIYLVDGIRGKSKIIFHR